ncbi:MAG TPA: helix-turn-helix transcriptional regulator [Chitinophagaceae bacterium]|jgi:transcriptional regulator with XRE-family HTH domain|nr:helix-turn-helix transcriptional regulator [Chitinophagaceae bacterium]
MPDKIIHEGRNVKRLREILGIKQDTLAAELGFSQQAISQLESKEKIDAKILEDVAKVLKVPVDAIKNFDEEAAINIISNTFHEESVAYAENYKCNFNPLDKYIEVIEENKKLYEALLKSEREKVSLLEKLLSKK